MGWLEGDVAVITGAGSGLGRALAQRFVEEGARVGALERSAEKAETLRSELGDAVVVTEGDVASYGDNERCVTQTVAAFGKLDVFVGNAGVWDFSQPLESLDGATLAAGFDELFSVNVKGYLLGARAALESLRAARGSIIFTASNAGLFPGGGGPLYTASKHAVIGLTRQLAYELAPEVRVNAVAPGGMSTDLRGPRSLGLEDRSIRAMLPAGMLARHLPLEIDIEAKDYAGSYVLLASRANARTATGTVMDISAAGVAGRRQREAVMAQMRGQ
jgi:2,3-dihydroxy-2,3-dihydrophenylpropionate dehydrogenase/cis-2,3-dihydrobiphenyl-2,3-diol dehydrogenase